MEDESARELSGARKAWATRRRKAASGSTTPVENTFTINTVSSEQVIEGKDLDSLLSDRPENMDAGDSGIIGTSSEPAAVSQTVLKLDRWNVNRGRDVADQWNTEGVADFDSDLVADAHASVFEPSPQFAERPADGSRAAWWKQLMETPEYQALHNQTCLDDDMSSIAAKTLCDQWTQYATDEAERQQEAKERGDGPPAEPGSDDEDVGTTLARMRSTQQALEKATEEVDTAKDIAAGLGMGAEGSPIDRKALAQYFKQVQSSKRLRDILAMAGRMRKLARSLQKNKTHATRGEITGVELGGDVGRLVSSELCQVAGVVPELELLAMKRLADRQSLCYKQSKNEPKRQGPIVIVVDESGSMTCQDRIVKAKGMAMALAWIASHQNRWVALVGFSGGTKGNVLTLPPKHNRQAELIDWLCHFYGGGTTMDVPLDQLPNNYWPQFIKDGAARGKTDVIVITDAQVDAPDEIIAAYREWSKTEQVKTYGIIVGGDEAGDLGKVCERHWSLSDKDLNMGSSAVESVLSI